MTVAAITRKAGPFTNTTASPVVGPFPFEFKIFALTDVKVVRSLTTDAEGASETLEYGVDYTVSANLKTQDADAGGAITLTGSVSANTGSLLQPGYTLAILSSVPYSQLTTLTNYDRFMPEVLNEVHDRAVANIQQLEEHLARALEVPATSSVSSTEMVNSLINAADTAEKVAKSYADAAQSSATTASELVTTATTLVNGFDARVESGKATLDAKTDAEVVELEAFGDAQVARVEAEGDKQVARIEADVDQILIDQSTGCGECQWVASEAISAGTEITIPASLAYVVGRHHLKVFYNGLTCYIDRNFAEVGNTDTKSNKFKLTFDVKVGDELDVWVAALGKADVSDAITKAQTALDSVADLSQKVVYKDETSASS